MSILIRNIEMPKNGSECPFCFEPANDEKYCHLFVGTEELCLFGVACPLNELPPHGDLIDRDDLISICVRNKTDEWNKQVSTTWARAFEEMEDIVYNAPTIIEAEENPT